MNRFLPVFILSTVLTESVRCLNGTFNGLPNSIVLPERFLEHVSPEGVEAYRKVAENWDVTGEEQNVLLEDWAAKYNVSSEYADYHSQMVAHRLETEEDVSRAISDLTVFYDAHKAITNSKKLTIAEKYSALSDLILHNFEASRLVTEIRLKISEPKANTTFLINAIEKNRKKMKNY